jgi:tetratricopeptide (TPR) repeat protein
MDRLRIHTIPFALACLVAVWVLCAGCSSGAKSSEPAPDSAAGLLEQAQKAYQAGLFDQAITLCQQSLGKDPKHTKAYLLLGVSHRLAHERASDQGHQTKEIEAFAKAVELDPGSLTARVNLASSLLRQGDRERANAHLEKAAAMAPDRAWAKDLIGEPQAEPPGQDAGAPVENEQER